MLSTNGLRKVEPWGLFRVGMALLGKLALAAVGYGCGAPMVARRGGEAFAAGLWWFLMFLVKEGAQIWADGVAG